jgi:lipid-A-disaccharide synthase
MHSDVFIITGESSGEMYGAALINELKKIKPGIKVSGIGGKTLEDEGVELLHPYNEVNFIGFSAVAKNIFKIKKVLNNCVDYVLKEHPKVLILVDFPGFNLKFASTIRQFYKGKIIYYISPQLWAWHKERIKIVKQNIDKMLVIFPFEVDFYAKEGVSATFVGHPLKEKTDVFLKNKTRKTNAYKIVTLMPGSRKEEVERILPTLLNASREMKKNINITVNILCSGNIEKSFYEKFLQDYNVNLIYDDGTKQIEFETIYNSDLLFTKSGTSTVECALLGSPFCIVYKTGSVNYLIGKNLIKVDKVGMVNILAGKEIVREFIQNDFTVENLVKEGTKLLTDEKYIAEMKNNFEIVNKILGNEHASKNAAKIISQYL